MRKGQTDTLQLGAKQKQPQATTAATRAAAAATGATIILDSHSTQGARSWPQATGARQGAFLRGGRAGWPRIMPKLAAVSRCCSRCCCYCCLCCAAHLFIILSDHTRDSNRTKDGPYFHSSPTTHRAHYPPSNYTKVLSRLRQRKVGSAIDSIRARHVLDSVYTADSLNIYTRFAWRTKNSIPKEPTGWQTVGANPRLTCPPAA